MAGLFKVSEIVDMAIDEEHNGVVFYEALEKFATTPTLKEAAARLAGEERGHEERFRALKDKLGAYVPPETYPGEYADYVNALLAGRTFPGEAEAAALANNSDTELAAIDNAIFFEKNTLLFLAEMQKLVPAEDRETVEVLIDEERGHLVDLSHLRRALAAG